MQLAIRIILIIIGAIVLLSLLQFLLSIFPPKFKSAKTPADMGLEYQDVRFQTKDNVEIAGWLIHANKNKSTIIVGHGYPFDKGNILPLAVFLHPRYNLLYIDFRSFGQSSAKMTTAGIKETEDINAATVFLKQQGYSPPYGALGFSMSASAIIMAQNPNIKAIVGESPYATMDEVLKDIYWIFPGPLKLPFTGLTKLYAKLIGIDTIKSPLQSLSTTKTPTLIIHGKKDSQIPIRHAYLLQKNANKKVEFWFVPETDHGQAHYTHKKEYEKRVLKFFKKHLN